MEVIKIMKSILLIVLFISTSGSYAQEKIEKLARVGGKGIFVFCSNKIPKQNSSFKSIRIERKSEKDSEFKKIAELEAVSSLKEFKKRFNSSQEMVPYPIELSIFNLDSIWNISEKSPTIKSLGIAGGNLSVLAGFNMLWLDKDVKEGISYEYRVVGVGEPVLESLPIKFAKTTPGKGLSFIKANYNQAANKIEIHTYSTDRDKPVYIETWRSENKAPFMKVPSTFTFALKNDSVKYRITDATTTAFQVYHYALKSWDVYGNTFPVSDTVFITALDYLQMPLPHKISAIGDSSGKSIKINWTQQAAGALKMMTLYRSRNSVNGFEPIAVLSAEQNEYIDEQVEPVTPYFYYFEVVFKASDAPKRTASFAANFWDKSKPEIPQYLETQIVDKLIQLSWQYNSGHTIGFNMYRKNADATDFKLIKGQIPYKNGQNTFVYLDNDSSMKGDVFYDYYLTAISTSHVEGLPSDTVSARPLINIPVPPAPLNVKATALNGNVFLVWEDVNALNKNVSAYQIFRTDKNSGITDTLASGLNHYNDTTAIVGIPYSYKIVSFSDQGIRSLPSASSSVAIEGFIPAPPSSLLLTKEKDGIKLSWDIPDQGELFNYEIYKYQRGSGAQKVGIVNAGDNHFTDRNVKKDQIYFYYVKSVSPNQIKSSIS
jgi:fibronectin type 3 domain-containing protein